MPCPNCHMPYSPRLLAENGGACPFCGKQVNLAPGAPLVFAFLISIVFWVLVLFTPIPAPHPTRIGILVTVVTFVLAVFVMVERLTKRGRWFRFLGVAVALAVAAMMKGWTLR